MKYSKQLTFKIYDKLPAGVTTAVEQAVLLALAFRANKETGACYPSISCIARMTRLNPRTVTRAVHALVTKGLISCQSRCAEHRPNNYTINEVQIDRLIANDTPPTEKRGAGDTESGAMGTESGAMGTESGAMGTESPAPPTECHTNINKEPPIEPSIEYLPKPKPKPKATPAVSVSVSVSADNLSGDGIDGKELDIKILDLTISTLKTKLKLSGNDCGAARDLAVVNGLHYSAIYKTAKLISEKAIGTGHSRTKAFIKELSRLPPQGFRYIDNSTSNENSPL